MEDQGGYVKYNNALKKEAQMYTYLASPYTHDDPVVVQERYDLANACAA